MVSRSLHNLIRERESKKIGIKKEERKRETEN